MVHPQMASKSSCTHDSPPPPCSCSQTKWRHLAERQTTAERTSVSPGARVLRWPPANFFTAVFFWSKFGINLHLFYFIMQFFPFIFSGFLCESLVTARGHPCNISGWIWSAKLRTALMPSGWKTAKLKSANVRKPLNKTTANNNSSRVCCWTNLRVIMSREKNSLSNPNTMQMCLFS